MASINFYSITSPIYAAASVAKIKACNELANKPNIIIGSGIIKGTKEHITVTVNSSATTFPKSRKFKDKGFVKSSTILSGKKKGAGLIYLAKYPIPFIFKPAKKYDNEVKIAKAAVVLISFVGAANSPLGISKSFHGSSAPAKFEPKTNKKIVAINGKNCE